MGGGFVFWMRGEKRGGGVGVVESGVGGVDGD